MEHNIGAWLRVYFGTCKQEGLDRVLQRGQTESWRVRTIGAQRKERLQGVATEFPMDQT